MDYIEAETFRGIDYSKQPLPKAIYENCTFEGCNFAHVDVSGYRFAEVEFVECNWSNAAIHDTSFQEVRFKRCKMLGLFFDQCNAFGFGFSAEHCQLDHSSFYQVQLTNRSLVHCQLQEVDFTEAQLEGTIFHHSNLRGAQFEQTNLEKADFRNASNYSIHPSLNRIKGAKFSTSGIKGLLDAYQIHLYNDDFSH